MVGAWLLLVSLEELAELSQWIDQEQEAGRGTGYLIECVHVNPVLLPRCTADRSKEGWLPRRAGVAAAGSSGGQIFKPA